MFAFAVSAVITCKAHAVSEIKSVVWNTEMGECLLSDTESGEMGAVKTPAYNSVTVTFTGTYIKRYASLVIAPAADGADGIPSEENLVLVQQQPVEGDKAEFGFYLKPSTADGVYAIYVGGAENGAVVKYFEVNNRTAPSLAAGQQLRYGAYKNGIMLKFYAAGKDKFAMWAAEKENMTIVLNHD